MPVTRAEAALAYTSATASIRQHYSTPGRAGTEPDLDEIARRLFNSRRTAGGPGDPGERATLRDYQTIVGRALRGYRAAAALRDDAGSRPTRAGTPENRGIPAGVDRYEYRVVVSREGFGPGQGPETVVIFRTTERLTASEATARAISSVRSSEERLEQSEGARGLAGQTRIVGTLISVSRYSPSS